MSVAAEAIETALHQVLDPCSIAANAPLSIVDMGLVLGFREHDGTVEVTLCLTSPMCLLGTLIVRDAEDAVAAVPGVAEVRVHVDPEPVWTPDRMTDAGRTQLAERRSAGRRLLSLSAKSAT
ncbi:metal-sulfur cluster assembly factor [Amycolatopsis jejuensis]|uniref:metal-sulfur cluster assembly factor n=1 Tax=Amycolatopsis jejuensis TaxID=330084 RepID=UPI00068D6B80|nr:metal-sulfur cluster assembly factor [Amycolatopsis jejuensis]